MWVVSARIVVMLGIPQGSSSTARELAVDISAQIQADQIFDFRRQQG